MLHSFRTDFIWSGHPEDRLTLIDTLTTTVARPEIQRIARRAIENSFYFIVQSIQRFIFGRFVILKFFTHTSDGQECGLLEQQVHFQMSDPK